MLKKENIKNIYTLSPMQEGMFFHALFNKNSTAYFEQISYRLHGSLNIPFVEKSLNELFKRYDILRTVFVQKTGDRLLQVVLKERNVDFRFEDILDKQDKEKESYIARYKEKDRKNVFDLTRDVLMRVAVIRVGPEVYEFIWSHHHILMDGWCVGILISEFWEIYTSYLENRPYRLVPVRPYRDYLEWLEQQDKEESGSYWENYLEGYETPAPIPRIQTAPVDGDDYQKAHVTITLEKEKTKELERLAGRNHVTVNTLIQTLWGILLGRYNGREDVVFGSVVSGRPAEIEDVESMVGLFINTIPVRTRFDGNIPFNQLLENVQEDAVNSEPYHYYSLADIQAKSPLKQNLLDHIIAFQNFPITQQIEVAAKRSPNRKEETILRVSNIENFEQTNYDFGILVTPSESERMTVKFDYNANVYDRQSIETMSHRFKHLLLQIVEWENQPIREFSFLSEEEKKQILVDFNDTKTEYPESKLLHQLFEEQAVRAYDKIAVIGSSHLVGTECRFIASGIGTTSITYRELNEKSNQLAHLLRAKGVKPDTIVAIMVTSSIEMTVGILGILKAGGAYLPIDPTYPQDRIDYMMADSNTKILVTVPSLAAKVKAEVKENMIYLAPEIPPQPKRESLKAPLSLSSSNIVYIIYTSGTTGRPKGVAVEHGNVVNTLLCRRENYKMKDNDVALQLFSYSFDGFVTSFFTPIISGARVVLVGEETVKDAAKLAGIIVNRQITHFICIPPLYRSILEYLTPEGAASLKVVTLAGDNVSAKLLEITADKNPGIEIVNEYGVTESSVMSTLNRHQERDPIVNIGKPAWNTSIYILDQQDRLQPVGIPGELCISGRGVGRGYINNPELTTEKFDQNLQDLQDYQEKKEKETITGKLKYMSYMSYLPYLKLYRTGDLAQWLPNGAIELSGRTDFQVKIRGFRIELGEIENQLLKYERIKETVVTAFGKEKGDLSLCAYIVPREFNSPQGIDLPDLHDFLNRRLPGFMVPSHFVTLKKIPLTPNGKVDRKVLPAPGEASIGTTGEYVQPHTFVEKKLVEVWQTVLGIRTIGTNENFFMIGGDSIKSIQVASRMNQAGYLVEIKDIFRYPTISGLASTVKKLERLPDQSTITGNVPLTPIQKRFFQEYATDRHHFNQSVMLYSEKGFSQEAIKAIFTKIQEHHDALRMTYNDENGEVIQTNHGLEYPLSLRVHDFRNRPDAAEALTVKANEIQVSINLETGPLMNIAIFRMDDGQRLLIVVHHLVIDGVSWRILFQDIERLYQQYQQGELLQLPSKTDSFKYWSEKLSQYANSNRNDESFLKERQWWSQLESQNVPPIKKDFEEGTNYRKDAAQCSFLLSEEETERLLTKVHHAFGTEINDILLTALALGIRETYGLHQLLIALEGHGREEILKDVHISRTVGWFTTLYPVILTLPGGIYEGDLGRQVKEIKETLRRVPQKGIGYGILKYLTADTPRTGMDFNLNPQVSFNYLGQFGTDLGEVSFAVAKESPGYEQSLRGEREYELDVSGLIIHNQLEMSIVYSKNQYRRETVETLLENYKSQLGKLIDYCSTRYERQPTPSDFTYKQLSIDTVDAIAVGIQGHIKDIYTLAPMQEGMLFHALYDPSSAAYFIQTSFRMRGQMDVPFAQRSLNELLKRYDILRTFFIHSNIEYPIQVVLKERDGDFFYEDISDKTTIEEKELFIKAFKRKDKERSFDLNHDVLMRLSVIQTDAREYELIWSLHHILMDGWCLGILISEFFEIYSSCLQGRPLKLPPVIPYVRYIQWLEEKDRETSKKYWAAYLDSYEEAVSIPPVKEPELGAAEYRKESVSLVLEREKIASLKRLTASNYVTLNTLVQATWGILLSRYNDTRDVVFGSVVSGRAAEIEGVESMVGLFINTIPVRIRYDESTTFSQLIRKLQEEALDSEPHHYYPLAKIQAETALKQKLLDHILVFENYPFNRQIEGTADKNKKELALEILNVDTVEQTNYDLNVIIVPDLQLEVTLEYNGHVYTPQFIEQVGRHFRHLLDQILTISYRINLNEPEPAIDTFTLLEEEEKKQLLLDFNNTAVEYPQDKTIHQLFEEQAEKTPDHIAVVGVVGQHLTYKTYMAYMTYKELNNKSNQLAHLLREKGVASGDIIGIMVERCIEMVVGIVSILKAGGAYLPIDPEYPEERIKYILEDSNAKVLMTTRDLSKEIDFKKEIIYVEGPGGPPNRHAQTANRRTIQSSESLAYVIYTSGSTGRPKGVMLEHRSVVNYITWAAKNYVKGEAVDFPLYTSISFDLTVTSLFTPLITGNAIVIYKEAYKELLIEQIVEENRVGVVKLTPAHLKVIRERSPSTPGNIKRFILGGEALGSQLSREIHETFKKNLEIYNEYGPTEAAVGCMIHRFDPEKDKGKYVPIGVPADNARIYLLDSSQSPVPVGVTGEMYISGAGVARGYLNHSQLTAETFVENPFEQGMRMYRTGDLAQWLPEGNMEFRGRIDHQVKIRGFRIETGEIESYLRKHRAIKDALVTTSKTIAESTGAGARENYLCAYIVPEDWDTADTFKISELRDYLLEELPAFMIPSYFVKLQAFPLNPNGKIDRNALPDPVKGFEPDEEYAVPQSIIEKQLTGIWQQVLGRDAVGIHDNFFTTGGDSIKAIQVLSRLSKVGYKVEMRELFRNPTIAQLGAKVQKIRKLADQSVVTGIVPLTPIQAEFFEKHKDHRHHYNQSMMLYSAGGFDPEIIRKIFTRIQEHHDALRMTFREEKGEIIQTNLGLDHPLSLQVYDLRGQKKAEEAIEAHANEIQASINLATGPLMKVGLFQLDDGDRLLIVFHHLVIDGVSWRILFEDIETLYQHFQQVRQHKEKEEPSVLPPKTCSFKLWSETLSQYANNNSGDFLKEKEYWAQLEVSPAPPPIKKDFEGGSNDVRDSEIRNYYLSREETERLLTTVNEAFGTENNDILLTALGLAVQEKYGSDRLLLALEGHGREEILPDTDMDISRSIGWFTSVYPVLLDFSHYAQSADKNDLSRQIKEIKENLRQVPRKGIGYGILKYLTAPENKQNIEFKLKPQISFNYLGQFDADVEKMSFELAKETAGSNTGPMMQNDYELIITCIVMQGQMVLSVTYSKKQYKPEAIEAFLRLFGSKLRHIITYCSERGKKELTPSDLTYNELSIDSFESIDALFD